MSTRPAASGRQGSIAGYFSRTPTKARAATTKQGPIEDEDDVKDKEGNGVIDLTNADIEEIAPAAKRRKVDTVSTPAAATADDSDIERLQLDLSKPFDFPPIGHPSYARPPEAGYNHPITIRPPPISLLEQLSFSQSPKAILKPSLNLDLLYFHSFISPPGSRALYDYFLDELPWYRVK